MGIHEVLNALAAQDATEAVALGWPVVPAGPDMNWWELSNFKLINEELGGLATRRGI